jgi:hypothetical protein
VEDNRTKARYGRSSTETRGAYGGSDACKAYAIERQGVIVNDTCKSEEKMITLP